MNPKESTEEAIRGRCKVCGKWTDCYGCDKCGLIICAKCGEQLFIGYNTEPPVVSTLCPGCLPKENVCSCCKQIKGYYDIAPCDFCGAPICDECAEFAGSFSRLCQNCIKNLYSDFT